MNESNTVRRIAYSISTHKAQLPCPDPLCRSTAAQTSNNYHFVPHYHIVPHYQWIPTMQSRTVMPVTAVMAPSATCFLRTGD